MKIEMQFSLYPLGEKRISSYINKVVKVIESHSLPVKKGPMSSITYGESSIVFEALNDAINQLENTEFVIVFTISNACPVLEDMEKDK